MVSIRCKMAVKSELTKLGLHFNFLEFGEIEINAEIVDTQLDILKVALYRHGLELVNRRNAEIINRIVQLIVQMIHDNDALPTVKNSHYISKELNLSYAYLSNLFSETKGITIERYIIVRRIECVKELLTYSDLSLTEISFRLHYSGVAHLSSQFKKITGLTPSVFKKLKRPQC